MAAFHARERTYATCRTLAHLRVARHRGRRRARTRAARPRHRSCRSSITSTSTCLTRPRRVEWQKAFGGKTLAEAPDRLMLGETRLIFLKNDKGQPSTGSALDHHRLLGRRPRRQDEGARSGRRQGGHPGPRRAAGSSSWHLSKTRGGRGSKSCRIRRSSACTTCHLRAPDPAATLAWLQGEVRRRARRN